MERMERQAEEARERREAAEKGKEVGGRRAHRPSLASPVTAITGARSPARKCMALC